jgi:hypothetical protein
MPAPAPSFPIRPGGTATDGDEKRSIDPAGTIPAICAKPLRISKFGYIFHPGAKLLRP